MDIYIIQVVRQSKKAPIKVGYAKSVGSRIAELQVGNHEKLVCRYVLGPMDEAVAKRTEKTMHKAISTYWIRGEWFSGKALGRLRGRWDFIDPPEDYWKWVIHGSGRG